jgi:hypothetical protein
MERTVRKDHFEQQNEPGFSVGFPVGVIAVLMLAITAYLVALDVNIPPPQTGVYLASDR